MHGNADGSPFFALTCRVPTTVPRSSPIAAAAGSDAWPGPHLPPVDGYPRVSSAAERDAGTVLDSRDVWVGTALEFLMNMTDYSPTEDVVRVCSCL
jgi:hypothetical protein